MSADDVSQITGLGHEDIWARTADGVAHAKQLAESNERLREIARRLVERRTLSADNANLLNEQVRQFTRTLRNSGAPPERALALLKIAVHPLVAAVPDESEQVLKQVVHWFVESYYDADNRI